MTSESKDAGLKKKTDGVFTVVLTGGPCGGKSSSLSLLSDTFKGLGWDVYSTPEVPTIMMGGGCVYPGIGAENKKLLFAFEKALIDLQLSIEDSFIHVARSTGKPSLVVLDRGVMDVAAYLPPEIWQDILKSHGWTEAQFLARYDLVLHLTTAAHGAEKFYTTSNNATRKESPTQARELDDKIRKVWTPHHEHKVVDNSTDFKTKVARSADHVKDLVKKYESLDAKAAKEVTDAKAHHAGTSDAKSS